MNKTVPSKNITPNSPVTSLTSEGINTSLEPSKQYAASLSTELSPTVDRAKKFTRKAASQFKSPLSGPTPEAFASVRLTPTIQALERKVQILKRAVKVKMNDEETELERLVKKWTDAGREVAWEVWGLVKDSGRDSGCIGVSGSGWGEENKRGTKRRFEEGWGWDDDKDAKKTNVDAEVGRNREWNVEPGSNQEERKASCYADDEHEGDGMKHGICENTDYEEDEKREDTLGTLLRQLGIAPETFGWNEDEGEFVEDGSTGIE